MLPRWTDKPLTSDERAYAAVDAFWSAARGQPNPAEAPGRAADLLAMLDPSRVAGDPDPAVTHRLERWLSWWSMPLSPDRSVSPDFTELGGDAVRVSYRTKGETGWVTVAFDVAVSDDAARIVDIRVDDESLVHGKPTPCDDDPIANLPPPV
jgi:hypothetical protein